MRDPLLTVERVGLTYGVGPAATPALDDVTLAFHPGEVTIVLGPSGSGKTTLLSVLGCLLTPDTGRVNIFGQLASGLDEESRADLRRRHIGFVFQSFRLLRALTAVENVTLALGMAGQHGPAARRAALAALDAVGLSARANHRPHELSGGEKQRVAIARALVKDPAIVLADEPTAALDTKAGLDVAERLQRLAVVDERLVVIVTHDPRLLPFAHRTIALRDGRVVEDRRGDTT